MKKNIHPQNNITTYVCASCKAEFDAISTAEGRVNVEVCSKCHPIYTGQAGIVLDTSSRIDRWNKQSASANQDRVELKKRKKVQRNEKVSAVKAGPSLTLKDMLKQAGR